MAPNKKLPWKPEWRGDFWNGWRMRRSTDGALGVTFARTRTSPEPNEMLDADYDNESYVGSEEEDEDEEEEDPAHEDEPNVSPADNVSPTDNVSSPPGEQENPARAAGAVRPRDDSEDDEDFTPPRPTKRRLVGYSSSPATEDQVSHKSTDEDKESKSDNDKVAGRQM